MNHAPNSPSVSPWRIGIGAGADEALPAGPQRQAFDRPAGRIGPVEHPHGLPVFRRRFQHVAQRRDEGVDAAAEILQVDQQHVERVHHRVGRPAHLAVEAEHRNAVHRIVEVRRLDHVVLLVAAQAVLRAEGGGELDVAARGQRIERMGQVCGDRGRMRQQRDALALERRAQGGFGEQAIDAEFHGRSRWCKFERKAIGMVEIRLAGRMRQCPVRLCGRSFPRSPPRGRGATARRTAGCQPIDPAMSPATCSGRRSTAPRFWARRSRSRRPSRPVAAEPIGRPLRRGRKVELVISRGRRTAHERLEAGVLPQLVGA